MQDEDRSGAGGPADHWGDGAARRPHSEATQRWPRTPSHEVPAVPDRPHPVIEGRYELLEPIGSGGMGEVWKAHDRRLRRFVAIKGLLDRRATTVATQSVAMQRARREAEAIAKIEHPNVVTVHDQVETEDQVWIVMKLLDARSLADLLRVQTVLAVPRAADIGHQILQGLRAVHAASVVHRDVKPGNVLVRDDGLVILVDFGIATFEGATPVTRSDSVIGTPSYLAPELFARGSSGSTPASDLWALGVTLYEMVEGHLPFGGGEIWEVQENILRSPHLDPQYAGPLTPLIRGLLRTSPGERLDAATAETMLREVLSGSAHTASIRAATRAATPEPGPDPAPRAPDPATPSRGEPDPVSPTPVAKRPRRGLRGRARVLAATACAVVLATAGWLVANGGLGEEGQGGDKGSGGTNNAAAAQPWKKTHPVLRIGVKYDQPGLSERVRGRYVGYDVDTAYKVAKRMGYNRDEVKLVPVTTENRNSELKKKTVHLVIASYTIRQDDEIDFVGPYYTAGRGFLVREKSSKYTIKDSSDLKSLGVEVCTAKGSTYWDELPKRGFTMMKSPPATYQRCLEQLLDERTDVYAVASDDVILAGYAKQNPGKVRRLTSIDGTEDYGVAMLSGQAGLKAEVCSAVRGILADKEGWEAAYRKNLADLMDAEAPPGLPDLDPTTCGAAEEGQERTP
ncbi:serine/threonine-protein kinase [Streptomyces sp. NPDC057702]|uniref:serine/threonine-protein kinase n=1 Tax=unclassified Streptomyces TaxID=2593676 RepID=UPI00368C4CDA